MWYTFDNCQMWIGFDAESRNGGNIFQSEKLEIWQEMSGLLKMCEKELNWKSGNWMKKNENDRKC